MTAELPALARIDLVDFETQEPSSFRLSRLFLFKMVLFGFGSFEWVRIYYSYTAAEQLATSYSCWGAEYDSPPLDRTGD